MAFPTWAQIPTWDFMLTWNGFQLLLCPLPFMCCNYFLFHLVRHYKWLEPSKPSLWSQTNHTWSRPEPSPKIALNCLVEMIIPSARRGALSHWEAKFIWVRIWNASASFRPPQPPRQIQFSKPLPHLLHHTHWSKEETQLFAETQY